MIATTALVALVWAADPKQPVIGTIAELFQPLLYLLLFPLPLLWLLYCYKSGLPDEVAFAVFAMLVPANSCIWAFSIRLVKRFFGRQTSATVAAPNDRRG